MTNDPVAFAKIIYNKDSGEIVGAATLNQKADEWINIMTLVINLGVKKEQLQNLIMAYPSVEKAIYSITIKKLKACRKFCGTLF